MSQSRGAESLSHGWALYVFLWDHARYPFVFELDDPSVFVPVASLSAIYSKSDGTTGFTCPQTIYARLNFDLGDFSRGFKGVLGLHFGSAQYKLDLFRPDLVRVSEAEASDGKSRIVFCTKAAC
jgi:hypothetical protein